MSGLSPSLDPAKIALLTDGLNDAASRGYAAAHYALVLIYRGDNLGEETSSSYWYSLMRQGREPEGVQLEWAAAYKGRLLNAEREGPHLRESTRLGWAGVRLDIALEYAQRAEHQRDFGQAEHWYKGAAGLGHMKIIRSLVWLAEDTGDVGSVRHWNRQAILRGDIEAVRGLIDKDDRGNLFQNWVWVYLTLHLGTDLRESTLRIYHENGLYMDQEYDDNQEEPLYVTGDEGVRLEALNAVDDARARGAAQTLSNQISRL